MEILDIILKIGMILVVFASFVVIVLSIRSMLIIKQIVTDLDQEIKPLIRYLTDTINKDVAKLDDVVQTVHDISSKVQLTSRIVQDIVSSPLIKAAGMAAGTRKAFDTLLSKKK